MLDAYAPEKRSMLAGLEGKKLAEKKKFSEVADSKGEIISKANRLVAMNKEIAENKANILKLTGSGCTGCSKTLSATATSMPWRVQGLMCPCPAKTAVR